MLEARGIGCMRGPRRLFANMDFRVTPGQLLRVGGENGSGKTSLLRILCGLLAPVEGEIRWQNQPINAQREEFHRDLAYIGHANGLKEDLTPLENLEFASTLGGRPVTTLAMREAMTAFGVAHCARLPVRSLSQGQRRRVALARLALPQPPRLWVLDEPFTALDARAVKQLDQRLANHVGDGGIVILTTHLEVDFAAANVVQINLSHSADRA